MEHNRRAVTILGALIALSTPISGLVFFAVFAVIFGEPNVEGSLLGLLAFVIPLVIGVFIAVRSHFEKSLPSWRNVAIGLGVLGVNLVGLAVLALIATEEGDPNIGAGILVFAGLLAFGAAAMSELAHRRVLAAPPPPTGPAT